MWTTWIFGEFFDTHLGTTCNKESKKRQADLIACIWPIDFLLHSRTLKRCHFFIGFAGNRYSGGNIYQQLMLALQWWNHIVFSLNHRANVTQVKEKSKSYYWWLTCHEQFENSSRLGMLNDHDLNPHICIVQSDHLISTYLMGAWLQFAYMSKRMFSSNILLL